MPYEKTDYWAECLGCAADEIGMTITPEQLKGLAEAVAMGHENYGMAFYSPPPSDRIASVEREWKEKYARLQKDLEQYQDNAETAIKQALRQHPDARVTIGEYGEVRKHDGRSDRIQ